MDLPVLVRQVDRGCRIADGGNDSGWRLGGWRLRRVRHGESVAGDSTTSSRPRRTVTRAAAPRRTFERPRAGPRTQRLVVERVPQALGRDALDDAHRAEGARRDRPGDRRSPGPPRCRRAPAPGSGGRASVRRGARSGDRRAPAAQGARCSRACDRGGRRMPPTIVIEVAPRARQAQTASSVSDSSLSAGERSSGIPAASTAAVPSAPSESPSPTTRSGRRPTASAEAAPPSAATIRPTSDRQPGQVASIAERSGASPSATIRACMQPGVG